MHYLTGTEHLVTVITDHKILGYFKQPQNLTHWQAWWWLFLLEYNIRWEVEWGINMGPTNTLSRKVKVETSDDNWEITLLNGGDQYFHIHAINITLADKISSSSMSDPIITKALTAMNDKSGESWIPWTTKTDWEFTNGALYFKHQLGLLKFSSVQFRAPSAQTWTWTWTWTEPSRTGSVGSVQVQNQFRTLNFKSNL